MSGIALQSPAALLYDRDCAFCRCALGVVLGWDRKGTLRPVALQETEAERLLPGLDEEQRMDSWHLVLADGSRYSAGRALAPLLRRLPAGAPLAALADAFPTLAEHGYRAVSDRRAGLHRLLARFGAC